MKTFQITLLFLVFAGLLPAQNAFTPIAALTDSDTRMDQEARPDRTRIRLTDEDPASDAKLFLNCTIFPQNPAPGERIWLEYALPADGQVAVELLDPTGYSFLLLRGVRTQGLPVDVLTIPSHLSPGTYYLKIKAGNSRAVVPVVVR